MKDLSIGSTDWPHLLADLTAKRDALNQVIAILTTQFGSENGNGASAPSLPRGRRTKSPRPPKPRRSIKRAAKPGPRTAPAAALDHPNRDQARTDAVLQLLAAGPLPTKAIAARLRQDRTVVKMALQRLKKGGTLEQVGHGPGTKWVLPRDAAKEAP